MQEGGCYWHLRASLTVRDAAEHLTMHRTAALQRIIRTEVENSILEARAATVRISGGTLGSGGDDSKLQSTCTS